MSAIIISIEALQREPKEMQAAVLRIAGLSGSSVLQVPSLSSAEADRGDLVRFSDADARKFFDGLGPSSKKVVKGMVDLGPKFRFGDLLEKLDIGKDDWRSLTGVWSGLTRRTKTIAGTDEKYLIGWDWHAHGDVADSVGELDPVTHGALAKVCGRD